MMKKIFVLLAFGMLFLTPVAMAGHSVKRALEDVVEEGVLGQTSKHKKPKIACDFISILPEEVKVLILSKLSPVDIALVSCVNRTWRAIASDEFVWQSCANHFFPHHHFEKSEDFTFKQQCKEQLLLRNAFISALYVPDLKPSSEKRTRRMLKNSINLVLQEFCCILLDDDPQKRAIALFMTHCDKGAYIFAQDDSHSFKEELILYGNQHVLRNKIYGLEHDKYGYEKDSVAARALIEQGIEDGHKWALIKKIEALEYGNYGYKEDLVALRALIEQGIKDGYKWAFGEKIFALEYGRYGYEEDLAAARALNEQGIKDGYKWALMQKIFGLEHGSYGYEENLVALRALIEQGIKDDHEWAFRKKSFGLKYSRYGYENIHCNGQKLFQDSRVIEIDQSAFASLFCGIDHSNEDPVAFKVFMEESIAQGDEDVIALKAIFLAFGLKGYEKNLDAAVALVKKYGVHVFQKGEDI